jgi:3-oxoacyl-(acyl-carrier-protein) synthase
MSLAIRGMGWMTPLGDEITTVWKKLLDGEEASTTAISSPISQRTYQAFRVSKTIPVHPRLRRSSAISRFAVAAGLSALKDAGVYSKENAARIALIFATSNGGVIYTKRFYHDIVTSGAQAASPLLFPETVFNAPASHLAAILGITGASYTLVGDGAVGILALQMAQDLMRNTSLDYCLVVAAEEVDWLLCDAYRKWRLLRNASPIEPFREPPRGMILSEGAGAIVIAREGPILLERVEAGGNFTRQQNAAALLSDIFTKLELKEADILIVSANGTFIDCAEKEAILQKLSKPLIYAMKSALGESVGAGAIWQIIIAAQTLLTKQLPPTLHASSSSPLRISRSGTTCNSANHAIISTCGLNQQAGGLRLSSAA